jgi:hypothetical protein
MWLLYLFYDFFLRLSCSKNIECDCTTECALYCDAPESIAHFITSELWHPSGPGQVLYRWQHFTCNGLTVDNHVPSSKFNRLNHTAYLLLSRNRREVSWCSTYSPPLYFLEQNDCWSGISPWALPLTSESRDYQPSGTDQCQDGTERFLRYSKSNLSWLTIDVIRESAPVCGGDLNIITIELGQRSMSFRFFWVVVTFNVNINSVWAGAE